MPLRCVAVDDEPLALEVIRNYISRFPALQLVKTFEDAVSAAEFMRQSPVDLLWVDIQMPDISGLDLVRSLVTKPMVIFTTAHQKFAFEGFELEAVDYLLKPIDPERFARAVSKAVDYHAYRHAPVTQPAERLFVYAEYRMIKIELREIVYIESLEDYIRIHLTQRKPIMTLMTLKNVLERLPSEQFKRIHRSYVVSLGQVQSIQGRKAQLSNGMELPISDSHYPHFYPAWTNR